MSYGHVRGFLFTQVHFTLRLSTWELRLFTGLAVHVYGILRDPVWTWLWEALLFIHYVDQYPQFFFLRSLMILEFELWFVGPKPMGFPAFFPAFQSQICFSELRTKPHDTCHWIWLQYTCSNYWELEDWSSSRVKEAQVNILVKNYIQCHQF